MDLLVFAFAWTLALLCTYVFVLCFLFYIYFVYFYVPFLVHAMDTTPIVKTIQNNGKFCLNISLLFHFLLFLIINNWIFLSRKSLFTNELCLIYAYELILLKHKNKTFFISVFSCTLLLCFSFISCVCLPYIHQSNSNYIVNVRKKIRLAT